MANRLWIYQTDRLLTPQESEFLHQKATEFCNHWQAHGKPLKAEAKVLENVFLILSLNEEVATATGCSIDSSVQFIREAASVLNVDFFNRLNVVYQKEGKPCIVHSSELEDLYQKGEIDNHTLFYNPLLQIDTEFDTHFSVPFSEHWSFRMVKPKAIV